MLFCEQISYFLHFVLCNREKLCSSLSFPEAGKSCKLKSWTSLKNGRCTWRGLKLIKYEGWGTSGLENTESALKPVDFKRLFESGWKNTGCLLNLPSTQKCDNAYGLRDWKLRVLSIFQFRQLYSTVQNVHLTKGGFSPVSVLNGLMCCMSSIFLVSETCWLPIHMLRGGGYFN